MESIAAQVQISRNRVLRLERVGFVVCAPGSFEGAPRPAAEAFFVVEGVFFLTNPDGSSRRCVGGDTVVLPKGWTGHWDVLEPVWKVWVEAE